MDNLYRTPDAPLSPPTDTSIRWRRIVLWSFAILLPEMTLATLEGLGLEYWEIYGSTREEVMSDSLQVHHVVIGIACVWLYWLFASGLVSRRFLSVAAVCCLAILVDFSIFYLAYPVQIEDYFDAAYMGVRFLPAMIGLGLAALTSPLPSRRRSTTPTGN